MSFGWKAISGYFVSYLLVYALTHWSWDVVMLLKHPGKAKYPYPKSSNIPAIIGFCLSTMIFWVSIILIPIRSIRFESDVFNSHVISVELQPFIRLLGMVIMSIGLFVGILGRWARGDWKAHNSTVLQTRLGFAIVRHPSYFQYLCGFIGVPLISLHMFTLILPLIGLYGYYVITVEEENRLLVEFGQKYREYQYKVGMFFPKIKSLIQGRKRQVPSIIIKNKQTPPHKLVGAPVNTHQTDRRNWVERFFLFIHDYYLGKKEKENYPSHPYYSSNENQGKKNYQFFAQTIR